MKDWREKLNKRINWWKPSRTQWGNVRGKQKGHRYCQWKNLPTWTKDRKKKTEVCDKRRNLVEIKCCSVLKSNCQWLNHQMQAPRRSVRGTNHRLSASFWLKKTKLTQILFISPHLTRFVARLFAGRPCFRLRGLVDLTFGLAIGGAVSKSVDVAVRFSKWSLWKVLIIYRRYMIVEAGSQVFSSFR